MKIQKVRQYRTRTPEEKVEHNKVIRRRKKPRVLSDEEIVARDLARARAVEAALQAREQVVVLPAQGTPEYRDMVRTRLALLKPDDGKLLPVED